jgi:hypothetical protein
VEVVEQLLMFLFQTGLLVLEDLVAVAEDHLQRVLMEQVTHLL